VFARKAQKSFGLLCANNVLDGFGCTIAGLSGGAFLFTIGFSKANYFLGGSPAQTGNLLIG
jgi:hypothetical protein